MIRTSQLWQCTIQGFQPRRLVGAAAGLGAKIFRPLLSVSIGGLFATSQTEMNGRMRHFIWSSRSAEMIRGAQLLAASRSGRGKLGCFC
jgi:hypothetical protein